MEKLRSAFTNRDPLLFLDVRLPSHPRSPQTSSKCPFLMMHCGRHPWNCFPVANFSWLTISSLQPEYAPWRVAVDSLTAYQ
jgi:hypothetical protein